MGDAYEQAGRKRDGLRLLNPGSREELVLLLFSRRKVRPDEQARGRNVWKEAAISTLLSLAAFGIVALVLTYFFGGQ